METISIIIPVYNEAPCLETMIRQMDELIELQSFKFNIIFIDDGSTDKSGEILDKITNSSYKIIHHKTNSGYGAAIKTGLQNSSTEYVCITDADGTYPSDEIPRLAQYITDEYSMIVGSRSGKHVNIPFLRKFPKWVLNKLANYLAGDKIPDLNSGLRIMKKKDVERFLNILPDGFSFTTTITLAMLTNNLKVYYTPINYFNRKGRSKIKPINDTLIFFQLIIRTSMYFNPLKVFVPASVILFMSAFCVLFFSWLFTEKIMDVTFGIMVMTSVIVLMIGMLADLIDKRLQ